MSPLVESALEQAGLLQAARARLAGDVKAASDAEPLLRRADLLVLGALADALRRQECGDEVRVFLGRPAADVLWILRGEGARAPGLDLLRRVAMARVTSGPGARIGVDCTDAGLELSQVALGFGATELRGAMANKRGLPIAEEATRKVKGQGRVSASLLQQRELGKLLLYVGRRALFVEAEGERRRSGSELEGGHHA